MASLTGGLIWGASRSHRSARASSTAARSVAQSGFVASVATLAQGERAVGPLDEQLHPGLGLRQLLRGRAQTLHPFLEQLERPRELDTFALKLAGDLLETDDPLLERHGRSVPVTTERTTP